MFKDVLLEIQHDLREYHRPKEELKKKYLNARLESSLNAYSKELEESISFLRTKKETTLLKKVGVNSNEL